jgi:hypothetical protein
MKDECHHLKHVQKRVLRSARRKTLEKENQTSFSGNPAQSGQTYPVEVYDEVIPSDQQIPRVPTRSTYH